TVFVVDDDEQVRESLVALIQAMNLNVQCYPSGREFLDNYSAEDPGCLVLDLRMPQTSGLEVIDELSARHIHLPIIMISGHGDIPGAGGAMKLGAMDFLEKPYHGAALMECVRRALERDRQNRQSEAERSQLLGGYELLTAEEKDVLELTAEGKPDKVIA